jgi:hypothetical protein
MLAAKVVPSLTSAPRAVPSNLVRSKTGGARVPNPSRQSTPAKPATHDEAAHPNRIAGAGGPRIPIFVCPDALRGAIPQTDSQGLSQAARYGGAGEVKSLQPIPAKSAQVKVAKAKPKEPYGAHCRQACLAYPATNPLRQTCLNTCPKAAKAAGGRALRDAQGRFVSKVIS